MSLERPQLKGLLLVLAIISIIAVVIAMVMIDHKASEVSPIGTPQQKTTQSQTVSPAQVDNSALKTTNSLEESASQEIPTSVSQDMTATMEEAGKFMEEQQAKQEEEYKLKEADLKQHLDSIDKQRDYPSFE
jgi:cytoskeletal protein RodZ